MRILSVASRLPDYRYPQEAITGALVSHWKEKLGERTVLLERLHSRAGVKQRYLAFPIEQYLDFGTWSKANRAWFEAAEDGACIFSTHSLRGPLLPCCSTPVSIFARSRNCWSSSCYDHADLQQAPAHDQRKCLTRCTNLIQGTHLQIYHRQGWLCGQSAGS